MYCHRSPIGIPAQANAMRALARLSRRRSIVWLAIVMQIGSFSQVGMAEETVREQIQRLEESLKKRPNSEPFDWKTHNELRHLYGGVDPAQSMKYCDIILKNSRMDGYILTILGGGSSAGPKGAEALNDVAQKYPKLLNLSAACWIRAGELSEDRAAAEKFYRKALGLKGLDPAYREIAEDRLIFDPSHPRQWPARIDPPKGNERSPGPWNDPDDLAVWPNRQSRANSDPWIAEHHDQLRQMRPRLLLINFSNEHPRERLDLLAAALIRAIGEASRYHGYADESAPTFLQYEIFKFVDLRDADRKTGDSRRVPIKNPNAKSGFNMKYRDYFSDKFAKYYGVPDPEDPKRFLRLDELLDGGYVHEVWFFGSGAKEKPHIGAFEVVEEKPQYDDQFRKKGDQFVQAGNGGDVEQPWRGRSVRLGFVNASRGIGCFMESLSHGIEGMSNSGAIPYFTRYFRDYAGFNLKEKYSVPFDSLYAVDYKGTQIRYPDSGTMIVNHQGTEHRIENYVATGGNAHFPPNGRAHYDLQNDAPVLSTIEDWRIGSGPEGRDLPKPFTNASFRNYLDMAPDCMGPWLIYWRQNMPGLNNRQKDDHGQPMKNWWPFLFY